MKKRILALCTTICLAVSLAACGGKDAAQDASTADGSNQSTTVSDTSDSDLPSLEDYFNSDTTQSFVDAAKTQYEGEGISAKLYAEGDELRYEFSMDNVVTTEEERPALAEALKTSIEANAESYANTAAQIKEGVSNDVVIVVVSFFDGEGNELYTQSFSSADAPTE
ncbi:DUF4854 domain-containing protein [Anaerotignum sp.]|uniref:DUF4854 domain-containing protein n=1 Tax=Anaerotignum sp. TaxID=2039241 RepID=UPI002A9190D5|nr:DUF4854 domain-containing protein [Anaerotignum sp.]MCI7658221.1 DUF4854 domain-containing protein [Clostridia bacterium]MDY5414440.1 DUF4854 domain-containing protein [Anaerotignum sp.]